MWVSQIRYDSLVDEAAFMRTKAEAFSVEIKMLRERLEDYKQRAEASDRERIEMREELLIASGVKRSKFDEQLIERQMNESKDEGNTYNQTRQWAHNNEAKTFILSEQEKAERARELMEQLEREFQQDKE